MRRRSAILLAAALVVALLGGCRVEPDPTVVAFLLASENSTRWTQFDEPSFRERLELTCPDCEYFTRNARGDAEVQAGQLRQALAAGADVVVLNAVTGESGAALVQAAGRVPVVAYDRMITGADYYVSYDADAIGTEMAEAVLERLRGRGRVLLLNGAQTDANGVAIRDAVHRVLDPSRVEIVAERDPDSWSAAEAATWVSRQLERHPVEDIDAIIAANDAQAAGVAQALDEAEVSRADWPLVTGQDADIEALRRIVAGRQTLTVLKSFPREAEQAADIAVTLVTGGKVTGGEDRDGTTAFVFDPVAVTLDNLTDTVVRDGIHTPEEICAGALRPRCVVLGFL